MTTTTVNIHVAKRTFLQLVKRAEEGERIIVARAGRPVAQLGPVPRRKSLLLPSDDPLLCLDTFAIAGPGGKRTNLDIDRPLYGHGANQPAKTVGEWMDSFAPLEGRKLFRPEERERLKQDQRNPRDSRSRRQPRN
jgi:prevent-host-death family protein